MDAALIAALAATPIAFALGDLYVANLLSMGGQPVMHLADAATTLPAYLASGGGPSTDAAAICVGFLLVCAVWVAYARHLINGGEHRSGEEHGSARWATSREIASFADGKNSDNNIILTKNCRIALIPERFDQKTDRNKNVCVVGGSGSGKTRYYCKPNIMQMGCSLFVTDPKGTLIGDMGHMLEKNGYQIRQFNTIDFSSSNKYNPLAYLETEADVLTFVECLIQNTTGEKPTQSDPFWEDSERLLYVSLVDYLLRHCPPANRNLPGLLTLLSLAEAREEDEGYKSPLDLLFDELETGMRYIRVGEPAKRDMASRSFGAGSGSFRWIKTGEPISPEDDFGLSSYRAFKTAAGKTLKSIIISCNVRLKPLSIKEAKALLSEDELELDRLGDPGSKVAVFASMPDTNSTFDFLFAILMWQTLDLLCNRALKVYGGSLPTHVRFILDEFANIGHIPDFQKTIAVVRSRNISVSIILQSLGQLAANYDKEAAQVITDNCDTMLFLGGKSQETNREISESIGKQTLSTVSVNDSRGSHSSTTRNYNKQERDLMQASEVGRLPRDEAIVLIAGFYPVKDKKFKLESHPRYKLVDPGHRGGEYKESFDFVQYWQKSKEKRMTG